MTTETVLKIEDLHKSYLVRGRARSVVEAVRGVSLELAQGEVLGLVGETGCGKSTIVRCLAGLTEPSAGSIRLGAEELSSLNARGWRAARRRMQVVFQNPYQSLDPRMTVLEIVREPLVIHHVGDREQTVNASRRVLQSVGIGFGELGKRPAQLSGGQRQRVAIARALVLDPEVLILDEPVSALDVSVQAQVINLVIDLQRQRQVSCLVILHDLAVASQMCNRVAVIYLGRIVEQGTAEQVLGRPAHPYTKGLLAAAPRLGVPLESVAEDRLLKGSVDATVDSHVGCRFRSRCPLGHDVEICRETDPQLRPLGSQQRVACHLAEVEEEFAG
jgi:oligopeptide/dipeptide ABC transporter ATP-binding protein